MENLILLVEKNYVGFPPTKKEGKLAAYISLKHHLLKKAQKIDAKICLTILNEYIIYFNDSHFGITKKGNKTYGYIKDSIKNQIPNFQKKIIGGNLV